MQWRFKQARNPRACDKSNSIARVECIIQGVGQGTFGVMNGAWFWSALLMEDVDVSALWTEQVDLSALWMEHYLGVPCEWSTLMSVCYEWSILM